MENENKKGAGKESQLSKIAAAVNPGSVSEANPAATQSMITTFVKYFESSALEIVQEMDDDQEKLINSMVEEITKLQTKNLSEFEKSINKIVALTNLMMSSDNSKLKELGQGVQDKAKEELLSAKRFNLSPENDTALNRLGARFNMDTEKTPLRGLTGVAKLAGGFLRDTKNQFKSGMKSAVGEGGLIDTIRTTEQQRKERELSRLEESSKMEENKSLNERFKESVKETLKQGKTTPKPVKIEKLTDLSDSQKKMLEEQGIAPASENDFSYRKDGKPLSIDDINSALNKKQSAPSSEQQEDKAGVSKDSQVVALEKTAESNLIVQENTSESLEILNKLLVEVKKIAEIMVANGGMGGSGGSGFSPLDMIPDIDLPRKRGRGVFGRIARSVGRGARAVGGAISRGGSAVLRGVGGILGFGTAAAAGAAGATGTGVAGATGATGAGLTGAAGATGATGKVVSGPASLASKAGNVLGGAARGAGKLLGGAARVAGKLALPLAAGMALYDGYKGFTADPNATAGQKFKNAGRNVLSGLTFGLVDSTEDKIAKGEYTGTQQPVQGKAEPAAKSGGFFSNNNGMMTGAALGPVGMVGGAVYDKLSTNKTGTETGRNVDGAIIEAGTAATKEKMQVNVPPPTIIQQNSGGGQSAPTITAPGGVGSVRSDDPTWLTFQKRRAVAM